MRDREAKMAGCADLDMTKKIVMGSYYKYEEEDDWFSHHAGTGEVRVIEGILCYAVPDIEYFEQDEYDACTQTERSSRRVIRWVRYDSTQ